MMSTLTVSITILLFCNCISLDTTALTTGPSVGSSANINQCTGTNVSQCVFNRSCELCVQGLSPFCTQVECVDHHCKIIPPCSIRASTTPTTPATTTTATPSNQCTGTNASQCVFHRICALCTPGLSPSCTEAVCVNNHCKIIPPCSIRISTAPTTSTESSTTTTDQCESDGQCPHPDYCVVQCKNGTGPLCASAKCVNKKCQTISPCSQTIQCTNKDLSRCIVPEICALCKVGLGPPCAQATCVNGQCGIITPCSQTIETTSTTPPTDACTSDGQCPYPDICELCKVGLGPPCAQGICVNGQCGIISPCSQTIETTSTTPPTDACTRDGQCPHPDYCVVKCPNGGTPGCASAKCVNGKCIIIAPCSQ